MQTTTIEARELEAGDQLVRTTKAGTRIFIRLSYVARLGFVGYHPALDPSDPDSYTGVTWEGISANNTPRQGLFGADEKVEVIR